MAEELYLFFVAIRDAQGAVTRQLLHAFVATLPREVQHNFMNAGEKRHDRFFRRWRRFHNVVDRRVSGVPPDMFTITSPSHLGVQQMLPTDYEERVFDFHCLLQDLMRRRQYQRIVVGDETGVRMEDIPNQTMEVRGAQSVKIRTSGKERQLFTVFLWSTIERNGNDWVCHW